MDFPSKYTYIAFFTKETDGEYSVRFPQLEGCYTQGSTFDEALQMARDAMGLHLYGMEKDGEAIPAADMTGYLPDSGEIAVPVTVWMTPVRDEQENRAIKKTLTIPAWLNDAAEQRKVNYSQILQNALKDYLGVYHP